MDKEFYINLNEMNLKIQNEIKKIELDTDKTDFKNIIEKILKYKFYNGRNEEYTYIINTTINNYIGIIERMEKMRDKFLIQQKVIIDKNNSTPHNLETSILFIKIKNKILNLSKKNQSVKNYKLKLFNYFYDDFKNLITKKYQLLIKSKFEDIKYNDLNTYKIKSILKNDYEDIKNIYFKNEFLDYEKLKKSYDEVFDDCLELYIKMNLYNPQMTFIFPYENKEYDTREHDSHIPVLVDVLISPGIKDYYNVYQRSKVKVKIEDETIED